MLGASFAMPSVAEAAPVLTVTPITWNVLGIDSNNPTGSGPDTFPIGARICNTGDTTATSVTSALVFDSASAFITPVGATTLTLGELAAGSCADAYYNVRVSRTTAAYDASRLYRITATADGLGTSATPSNRELYVERLISQNRNSVLGITSSAIDIAPTTAAPGHATLVVGQAYSFTVTSKTATGGYEQLESFLDFPNTNFQILAVSTNYAAPPGATNDTIYADACGWDNNIGPRRPIGTYLSCVGPLNYPGGKAGGNPIVTTFTVKVIAAGSGTLSTLIYDFSGSSFHYNSDFGGNINSVQFDAFNPPDLAITKSHTGNFTVGTNGTYTLTVANVGGLSTTGPITVTDTLPAGLSFVSATGNGFACSATGQTVTCSAAGALAPGSNVPITLTVGAGPAAAPSVTNTATVATSGDTNAANDTSSDPTTVTPQADLVITKTGPTSVSAGGTITYTLTATNNGPSSADGVTISDTIPPNLSSPSTPTGFCSIAGGALTCNAGTLASGASFVANLSGTAPASGTVTNTATVSSTTEDPVEANNSSTITTDVGPQADLAIAKTGPASVNAGGTITYTLTATNNGPSSADAVTISDTVPPNLSSASTPTAGCSIASGVLTCNAGTLASGATFVATLSGTAPASGTVTNTATVSSTTADPVAANNSSTASTTIRAVATISGVVFNDQNGDAARSGDPGITGVTVVTTGAGADGVFGTGDDLTFNSTTDGNGAYSVSNLFAGQYRVAVSGGVPAGFVLTTANDPTTLTLGTTEDAVVDFGYQAHADLAITKTAQSATVGVGQDVTWTINVVNNGPAVAAAPITVTDPVPSGLVLVSATGTDWTCSGTTVVSCTYAGSPDTLASGAAPPPITLVTTVMMTAPPSVTNTASVSSPTADPTTANNNASSTVQTRPVADIVVTKSHAGSFVVGTQGSYTVVVANNGPSTADGPFTLSDNLPAGLAYVSATGGGWSCSAAGQLVTCNRLDSLATATTFPPVTIVVDVGTAAEGGVTNVATIAGGATFDPDPTNNSASDPTRVTPVADLSITKTAPGSQVVGQTAEYLLVVANAGPSSAVSPVAVTDTLAPGMTFVSGIGTGWTCSASGQDVSCSLVGPLAAGATSTITLTVTVDAAVDPTVSNTAVVSSPTFDPDPSNNTSTVDTNPIPTIDLALTKTHTGSFPVGGTGTYTLIVANNGPSSATGTITLSDTLPSGLTPSAVAGAGWTCSVIGQSVSCTNPGPVAVGASLPAVTLTVTVAAAAYPTVTNTAVVIASSGVNEPTTANNTSSDPTSIAPLADLAIAKSHTGDFTVGVPANYTLTITNTGPTESPGPVTVVDDLPAGLAFVSATGAGWSCTAAGQTVTCTLASAIGNGGSSVITLSVLPGPAAEGTVTNRAAVSAPSNDPNPDNNTASDTTTVGPAADLAVTKTHAGNFQAGTMGEYSITVTNRGPSTASGPVTLVDTLPAGLSYQGATGAGWSCTATGQAVTCVLATPLVAGASSTMTLRVSVSSAAVGTLTNRVVATSATSDPNPANNTADDPTTVTAVVDLALTKTLESPLVAGTTVSWLITVTNVGPSDVPGPLTVTDALPAGLEFVGADGEGWVCSAVARVVTCTHPSGLVAGAGRTLRLRTLVTLAAGGSLTNTAVVTAVAGEITTSNNRDSSALDTVRSPPSGPPVLPVTGAEPLGLVEVAGILILGGLLLLLVSWSGPYGRSRRVGRTG